MKPVYKCDYCSFTGIEDEVKTHEESCIQNHNKKSCYTCKNKELKTKGYYCEAGIDIPEGKIYENCELYVRNERVKDAYYDLINSMFGG